MINFRRMWAEAFFFFFFLEGTGCVCWHFCVVCMKPREGFVFKQIKITAAFYRKKKYLFSLRSSSCWLEIALLW